MHRPVRFALASTLALVAVPALGQDVEDVGHLDDLPPLVDREIFFGNPKTAGGQISPDARRVSFLQELDGVINVWVKGIDESFDAAGEAKTYRIEPAGTETVEIPAGSFETRRLEVRDTEGSDDQTYWITPQTGQVVKSTGTIPAMMGGGTVTTVFTGAE